MPSQELCTVLDIIQVFVILKSRKQQQQEKLEI